MVPQRRSNDGFVTSADIAGGGLHISETTLAAAFSGDGFRATVGTREQPRGDAMTWLPVLLRPRVAGVLAAVAAVLLATGLSPFEALFAPSARLWERWAAHDPASAATIDHSAWDEFLGRFVARDASGVNRFAYARLVPDDRRDLGRYVEALAATPISRYARSEQLAFWINLYNALTVKVVVDHSPVTSIRDIDISPGLFAVGPWGRTLVTVEGEALSLNDIEHRILRPIWRDPRIHYAVNCAALGCPNLQERAFTGTNADLLMDKGAREFVNHPRGVAFDGDRLVVSSIYAWFAEDFGGSDATILAHLGQHADTGLAFRLAGRRTIDGHRYDWRLNEASVP